MFETSVVRAEAAAIERRVSFLTLSLFAHTAVIAGAVAISIATVEFPRDAPPEYRSAPIFAQVRIPPPLGTERGSVQKPEPAKAAAPAPSAQLTAPGKVSETIPSVAPESPGASGAATGPSGEGPIGVPWGTAGSTGDLDAPPATGTLPPVEEKIYQPGGEVIAPVLIQKVEPVYPPLMVRTKMKATVVVRCVIDRSGRVRDPEILSNTLPPFNNSVITAVQQWKFRPGSLHGQTVETYLDLTVNFAVAR